MVAVELLTPNGVVYSGDVSSVRVPGVMGSFAVLDNHAPLISPLEKGLVLINAIDGVKEFTIDGGVVEVLNNHVVILAESIVV